MHHRISILAVSGVALACASAHALAQAPNSAPAARQPLPRTEVTQKLDAEFKALDTNGDGRLTKPEVQAAIVKRAAEAQAMLSQRQKDEFAKLDTNKDGRLTLAEYQAGTTVSARENAADIRMNALDANKDGGISASEYRAATLSQFDKLDKNKDGILTPQEGAAAR
jgi:hypothetical protein